MTRYRSFRRLRWIVEPAVDGRCRRRAGERKSASAQKTRTAWQKGVTLVELVIVSLIIGIAAVAVAPRFVKTLQRESAEAAARRIQADLGLARQSAVTTSSPQIVSFSATNNQYFLPNQPDLDRPQAVYRVSLGDAPYKASILYAEFDNPDDSDIEFNGFGIPDGGGTIAVQVGAFQRLVVVSGDTGHITVTPAGAGP